MGFYSEYLDRNFNFPDLSAERKTQLRRISEVRDGRDILVYAADLDKQGAPVSLNYGDLLPINDQLSNLSGAALDLIIETPGGSGEVAEDVVRLLRAKYQDVAVIVPGWSKSAGTMIVMAADDILMGPASAIGPIDPQINLQGKQFSVDALLDGFEKIKKEVVDTGNLNKAYIPMLQGISPGELQAASNQRNFAKELVTESLRKYKFRQWTNHRSDGRVVTDQERRDQAEAIANELRNHNRWLTHGRSIKIADLESLGLRITDYSKQPKLAEAIGRYYVLLQMTFATNIYKVIETPSSQIYRFMVPQGGAMRQLAPTAQQQQAQMADVELECSSCHTKSKVQANFGQARTLRPGYAAFPQDNKFHCPQCGTMIDLADLRRQLESQAKQPIVA